MIKINNFEKNNLKITWTAIEIGLQGYKFFPQQLDYSDIVEYAVKLLVDELADNEEVILLASCNVSNFEEIKDLVSQLKSNENLNCTLELRKWVVLALDNLLHNINIDDYIDGLNEITHFWSMFDYPEFSPHQVQGRKNEISPKDYYSKENYKKILNTHKNWLTNEFKRLSYC